MASDVLPVSMAYAVEKERGNVCDRGYDDEDLGLLFEDVEVVFLRLRGGRR